MDHGPSREALRLNLPRFLQELASGRLKLDAVTLTSHHFMSPEELATPLGQERLRGCVFTALVDGSHVPMCTLNASGGRESFYRAEQAQNQALSRF